MDEAFRGMLPSTLRPAFLIEEMLKLRWRLGGQGWPCGAILIPAGVELEGVVDADGGVRVMWGSTRLPSPPPLDCIALDAEAALFLLKHYDPDLWHRLVFERHLDRAAILEQARHARQYPPGQSAMATGATSFPKEEKSARGGKRK